MFIAKSRCPVTGFAGIDGITEPLNNRGCGEKTVSRVAR
jgi:hypothetical protein